MFFVSLQCQMIRYPLKKNEKMLNKYAMLKHKVKSLKFCIRLTFPLYSKLNVSNVWSVYYKISLYLW